MSIKVKIKAGDKKEEVITLESGTAKIGSLLSNQVVLDVADIEAIHALLEVKKDSIQITELTSDSTVQVNGKSIKPDHPLNIGDTVKIHSVTIEILPITKAKKTPKKVSKPIVGEGEAYIPGQQDRRRRADTLFTPRTAKATNGSKFTAEN